MRKKIIRGYAHPIERTKIYDVSAIELAKSIIEKDPVNHFPIPILADRAGINEFKLKQGFRELFKTSPYQYRLFLCLKKAKQLLEETDDTIDQIASKVGFETYNGFSTAFKKAFHVAPTEYRNRQEEALCYYAFPIIQPFFPYPPTDKIHLYTPSINITMKAENIKSYDFPYILEAQKILIADPARQLTITALALEVGINSFKLRIGFKQLFKTTIHQYRLNLRLNLAKQLLTETDLTISEIAYKTGFESRDGFARCFRRHFQETPRGWRKSIGALFTEVLF